MARWFRHSRGQLALGGSGCALVALASLIIRAERGDGAWAEGVAPLSVWRNWSNNHAFRPGATYEPRTQEEVERIVRRHHESGRKLRVLGSGLSPNGIAFGKDGEAALSMEGMSGAVWIDPRQAMARFRAGTTVGQCAEELAEHGIMLENLASINLQQLGGFYQVGAHGTGARIPPVDEQIVEMTLVTPSKGTLTLSATRHPELFSMAKNGLGALGVVTDFTVRCIPLYNVEESVRVISRSELRDSHAKLVRENKHAKYMWVPFEDKVVVVLANPTSESANDQEERTQGRAKALGEMHKLYEELFPGKPVPHELNFADLRTLLLAKDNLSGDLVRRINRAETSYHMGAQGSSVKPAEAVMAFDCGGQQLVLEMAMRIDDPSSGAITSRDVDFVLALLDRIEKEQIPAPIPIEHRFTSGSSAALSVAPGNPSKTVYGWVGIVMYMPDDCDRENVKREFARYSKVALDVARSLGIDDLRVHWAKLEVPADEGERMRMREQLERLFPLERFRSIKSDLDPNNCLGSRFVDDLVL